jgi:hypothetical protein
LNMQSDVKPVFRKAVSPWYDSNTACLILAAFMLVVVLCGICGIRVACGTRGYEGYVWIPVLLVIFGLFVCVSCLTRVIRRCAEGG